MSIQADWLTPERIAQAHGQIGQAGQTLTEVLEAESGLSPDDFLTMLGRAFAWPTLNMAGLHELAPAFDALPFDQSLSRECYPARDKAGRLLLVFADPFDTGLPDWVETRITTPCRPTLARRTDILAILHRQEEGLRALDTLATSTAGDGGSQAVEELSLRNIGEDLSPAVRMVSSTLYDALVSEASDIHLENDANGLSVKYRVDGVLGRVTQITQRELADQVVSRIKVLAELDISERRIPQDGRFKVSLRGREIDLRVSIMPGVFGEDAVLRVLDRRQLADTMRGLTLDSLGFDAENLRKMRRLSHEPYGMVLVTGPTGSGKTTTLYAALSEINHGRDKIITIEDPVEYQLSGVLQIPVNEKKGLSFARGLRSILRHDPDKIMVGEIRDPETAQIAVQSALTGHLVFTTVHANNVFDVIGRFMHMGVDPYSLVSALNGVLAQRLIRVNCPQCAEPVIAEDGLLEESGLTAEQIRDFDLRVGRGCGSCRGSGYKGRKAVAEVLLLNDEIRELIIGRAPIRQLKEAAARNGTQSLREAALQLVRQGETTLEEINRVTFVA